MSADSKYERMPQAYPTYGGYQVPDADFFDKSLISDIWNQIKSKLQEGSINLIKVSLPVRVCEPKSYLQRIVEGWCFMDEFLGKAAKATDPVERMKYVIAFAVSGLHNSVKQKKPFNPILGETFEGMLTDGTQVYCEQSSHHPPVSNWLVYGPNNLWRFYGFGEWTASFRGNSIRGRQEGPHIVEFPDGTRIIYELPEVWIKGLLFGTRLIDFSGSMKFRDDKNGVGADIVIDPPVANDSSWSSWFGYGAKLPSDFIEGELFTYKLNKEEREVNKRKICSIDGSWLGEIRFDNKPLWKWSMGLKKVEVQVVPDPLPSDCRFRSDLIALEKGDMDLAQKEKERLENIQRREAKLRENALVEQEQQQEAQIENVDLSAEQ